MLFLAGKSLLSLLQLGMRLSSAAYASNFVNFKGQIFSQSTISDFEKPVFYVYIEEESLFIITRGSLSTNDYLTDAEISEISTEYGVFHKGFYNAANFVFENVQPLINSWNGPVFFVGHSYGGSVSQIMLVMSHRTNQSINAYALSFAPMPCMNISTENNRIQNRIFTVINNNDIVPTLSVANVHKKFAFLSKAIDKIPVDVLVEKFDDILRLMKLTNSADSRLLTNLMNSVPIMIRSVQEYSKGVEKVVRYPAGQVYKLKLNKSKTLQECKIDPEIELNKLSVHINSINDHNSDNYLKVIDQVLNY